MDFVQVISLLAYIATIIAAIAVTVTMLIYYGQLNAMAKARQLEAVLKVFEYADRLDLRHVRYFVYQHPNCFDNLPNEPFTWAHWNELDKKIKDLSDGSLGMYEVDLWINALNNIAFLVRDGYAPQSVLTNHLRNIFVRCDRTFHKYIDHRQSRAGDLIDLQSMYGLHFEWAIQRLHDDEFAKS